MGVCMGTLDSRKFPKDSEKLGRKYQKIAPKRIFQGLFEIFWTLFGSLEFILKVK